MYRRIRRKTSEGIDFYYRVRYYPDKTNNKYG